MKFLDKLGLAVFSIIVLVISIVLCLIVFGWMEPTIFSVLVSKALVSQTYTYVLLGVCFLLIILALRCIFFSDTNDEDEDDNGILLQNEDGKLLITTDTLKDMVEGVVEEFPNITDSVTNVAIDRDNEIIIETEIDITKQTVIIDISSKIQSRVKKKIKEATGLDIKYVNVRVRNAEQILSSERDTKKVTENPEKVENKKEDIKKVEDKKEEIKQPNKEKSKPTPKTKPSSNQENK